MRLFVSIRKSIKYRILNKLINVNRIFFIHRLTQMDPQIDTNKTTN